MQSAIDMEDPDIILDLRKLNKGKPGNTFQVFFDELQKIVNDITAADERRHNTAHMSQHLSIR